MFIKTEKNKMRSRIFENPYIRPTLLFTQEECDAIDWDAFYGEWDKLTEINKMNLYNQEQLNKLIGLSSKDAEAELKKQEITNIRMVSHECMITADFVFGRVTVYLDKDGIVSMVGNG